MGNKSNIMSFENIFSTLLRKYSDSRQKRFLILIGGCSRTGKSTLAKKIQIELRTNKINSEIVKLDNWLIGINERTGLETVRERFNYKEIIKALRMILRGEIVNPPFYDQKTRLVHYNIKANSIQLIEGVCIFEGVVALDIPELREFADFMIYTEINDKTRKERLFDFYYNYKNLPQADCEKIINEREVEEVPLIKRTKKYADFVFQSK